MTGHRFDATVLREYDIRGVVGQTLTADDARAVGLSFGTLIAEADGAKICVGYDGRLSSPELEAALVEGLSACGLEVLRVGLGPTPMLYFAVHESGADGGVMVTGSHNPPEFNGFKFMAGTGPFYGEDIRKLGELAAAGAYIEAATAGAVSEYLLFERYIERLAEDYSGGRVWQTLNVAWDAGNGSAGPAMAALSKRLPGRHFLINETVDGTFPNHHPDPTVPENLAQLIDLVRRESLDVGIALDGDGDRIGVVDGQGRVLWGDQLMVLLATDVLASNPGAIIIADVKASQTLFSEVRRMGGRPLMWRTGHSLIKAKMAETGAPLAGEMSGHIFFSDRYYGFDDALYAAVRLLGYLSRTEDSLSEIRTRLPQAVNTPELRFPCDDVRKFQVIEEVGERLRAEGAKINDIDGLRVRTRDGWWLLRASNTQGVLVARCEAKTQAGLDRLCKSLSDQLSQSGVEPPRF